MSQQSKLVDEVVGAELVAGRELVSGVGSIMDTLERGGAIQQQQLSHLLHDYATCSNGLIDARSITDVAGVFARLLGNRIEHVGEGARAWQDLLTEELVPLGRTWSGFMKVLEDDRKAI